MIIAKEWYTAGNITYLKLQDSFEELQAHTVGRLDKQVYVEPFFYFVHSFPQRCSHKDGNADGSARDFKS